MRNLFRLIGKLLKGLLHAINFVRLLVVNLLFLIVVGIIIFAINLHPTTPGETMQVDQTPSALVLNLSGPIVEKQTYINPMDSFSDSLIGRELPRENVLYDVARTIRFAANDDNITGLVLVLRQMPETNLTKLRYIAKAINEFKASGKPVFATGDTYNQSQYYLASHADKIMMSPDGGILLQGYSSYNLYYKELLDKLDLTTHVFRVGTYKSAVEPFMRNDMSAEAKESATRWLSQLWGAYLEDIAANRQLPVSSLNPDIDEFLVQLEEVNGDLALWAKQNGLVDHLATRQERLDVLIDTFGQDDSGYNNIGYYQYAAKIPAPTRSAADDIAVVVARGAIMNGQEQGTNTGGDTTAMQLREARLDDRVKAVVLRIDSPGGSATASEIIRNEVVLLREAGKPVVVSMSSLAASGGYWIAMNADKIVAQPTTLTGSIGIFSVIATAENSLSRIGVNTDGVGTTPFSGAGLVTGLSEGVQKVIQMRIEHGYESFTGLVAEARDMELDAVDAVAQGQVWTGFDAKQRGLVDEIGDLDYAIETAAELAELDEYNLHWVQEPLSATQIFIKQLFNDTSALFGFDLSAWLPRSMTHTIDQAKSDLNLLQQLNDPQGAYALCLTCQLQ